MQGNTSVQAQGDGDRVVAHHHQTVARGLKVKTGIKAGSTAYEDVPGALRLSPPRGTMMS